MKVLLVDVDSKIANLALMRLATYYRSRGDQVELYRHRGRKALSLETENQPNLVCVSCLFTWNRPVADGLVKLYCGRNSEVIFGGTGFDHGKTADQRAHLPPEAEFAPPDYGLYGVDYAVGFCNRGCDRKCQFCDVPLKEGLIDPTKYRPPWTWVPDGFKKAMLLDNDPALYGDAQHDEIFRWFIESGVKCSITQGYDIRCVTPARAALLAELKPTALKFNEKMLYIAWDYLGIEGWVRKNLPVLLDAGFHGRDITCYTIVGFDPKTEGPTRVGDPAERASALHRFKVLWKEFGVFPYVMPYNNRRDDPWIRAFARFINRKIFKACAWEDYRRRPE